MEKVGKKNVGKGNNVQSEILKIAQVIAMIIHEIYTKGFGKEIFIQAIWEMRRVENAIEKEIEEMVEAK